jgi:conjugal transfer/entry exclusion protein
MAAYARQAKDTELIQYATEIKVRAERRAGEMLAAMPKAQGVKFNGRAPDGSFRQSHDDTAQTLADIGVSNVQSSRWQSLAGMSDEHFETAVATAKDTAGQVTTAFMLREANKVKPQGKAPTGPRADAIREELKAAKERGVSMLETYARLTLTAVRAQDSFTEQERSLLAELMDAIAAVTA